FSEPAFDPLGICGIFGQFRDGSNALIADPLQRIGVRPDGSAVVFEVNSDFAILPGPRVPTDRAGIYFVRSDGTGLRRLALPSRDPAFRIVGTTQSALGIAVASFPLFFYSPDGGTVVYTDHGPGPAGEDTVQIVTLDLSSGRVTPVTHLPAAPSDPFSTCCAR